MFELLSALEKLEKTTDSCGRLSVWHIRAYLIGAQSLMQMLNVDAQEDAMELEAFFQSLSLKYGNHGSEYGSIWLHACSPRNSADLFLDEWRSFVKTRGLVINSKRCSPSEINIDLYEKLSSIEKRPQLYFAEPDIYFLKAWFEGIQSVSEYFYGVRIEPELEKFEKWMRNFTLDSSTCPWDMILTANCGGDATMAFKTFFEQLRLFNKNCIA